MFGQLVGILLPDDREDRSAFSAAITRLAVLLDATGQRAEARALFAEALEIWQPDVRQKLTQATGGVMAFRASARSFLCLPAVISCHVRTAQGELAGACETQTRCRSGTWQNSPSGARTPTTWCVLGLRLQVL